MCVLLISKMYVYMYVHFRKSTLYEIVRIICFFILVVVFLLFYFRCLSSVQMRLNQSKHSKY